MKSVQLNALGPMSQLSQLEVDRLNISRNKPLTNFFAIAALPFLIVAQK